MKTRNIIKKSSFIGVLALAVFLSSCEDEMVEPINNNTIELKTIPETLDEFNSDTELLMNQNKELKGGKGEIQRFNSKFKTLRAALDYTGLTETVAKNRFTVLAPTDEAFEMLFDQLGINSIYDISAEDLTPILLYHVFTGKVYSANLETGYAKTANGASVKVMVNGSVMFNDATVVAADIKAMNGLIHAINKVLLPPTLVDLAMGNDDFSILVMAVAKAGLVETLKTGDYTVFAPTNAAFVNLLGELGFSSLDDIPVPVLTDVLLYHVLPGSIYSGDLPATTITPTAANGKTFDLNATAKTIKDLDMRVANLVAFDISASNGVIHVIDKVILPDIIP